MRSGYLIITNSFSIVTYDRRKNPKHFYNWFIFINKFQKFNELNWESVQTCDFSLISLFYVSNDTVVRCFHHKKILIIIVKVLSFYVMFFVFQSFTQPNIFTFVQKYLKRMEKLIRLRWQHRKHCNLRTYNFFLAIYSFWQCSDDSYNTYQ